MNQLFNSTIWCFIAVPVLKKSVLPRLPIELWRLAYRDTRKAKPDQGYVLYISYESDGAATLIKRLDFDDLIFVREWFAATEQIN